MKLTYTERNGVLYPDPILPKQTERPIGKYGKMRLDFLLLHRRGTYTTLLTEGRLNEYLYEVDREAKRVLKNTIEAMAEEQGVTEELKASDPLKWAQKMNNIKACAEAFA